MKVYDKNIIKNFLVFLSVVFILLLMIVFRYYIEKQEPLKIEELNELVEKEIIETHGRN
jgi:hypothetical protein